MAVGRGSGSLALTYAFGRAAAPITLVLSLRADTRA
jgi:hypothetical protein